MTVAEVAAALRATGGIRSLAAEKLKVTRGAITHFAERHPEILEVEADLKEQFLDLAEAKLLEKIRDGDPTTLRYFLDQHGAARGYGRKVIVTNPPGQPFQTEDVSRNANLKNLSRDELRQLRALQLKLAASDGSAGS